MTPPGGNPTVYSTALSGPWSVYGLGDVGPTDGSSGSGYHVGDVLTLTGNGTYTPCIDGTATATSVDSITGAVTGVSVTTAGSGYVIGNGYTTTGGSGSGCTIDVTSNCADTPPMPTSVIATINAGNPPGQPAGVWEIGFPTQTDWAGWYGAATHRYPNLTEDWSYDDGLVKSFPETPALPYTFQQTLYCFPHGDQP